MRTGYNIMHDDADLLEQHAKSPPSFSIHLYAEHWALNGNKTFAYTNQVSSLLDDIRAYRIPTDFIELFDAVKVPYYEGCLIVELLDYRVPKSKDAVAEKPDLQRVVLRPTPETLWQDLCLLNQRYGGRWTDLETIQVEAEIVKRITPNLILTPDPSLSRVFNSIARVTMPSTPTSLKRSVSHVDQEEDESEKKKRLKLMTFMDPHDRRVNPHPSYKVLQFLERRAAEKPKAQPRAVPPTSPVPPAQVPVDADDPNQTVPTTVVPNGLYIQPPRVPSADPSRSTTSTPLLSQSQPQPQPQSAQPQNTVAAAPITNSQSATPASMQPSQDRTYTPAPASTDNSTNRVSPAKQQLHVNQSPRHTPAPPPLQLPPQQATSGLQQPSAAQSRPPSQPQALPSTFQPPIPPPHFLNQPPPPGKRRPSQTTQPQTQPMQPPMQQQPGTPSLNTQPSPQMQPAQASHASYSTSMYNPTQMQAYFQGQRHALQHGQQAIQQGQAASVQPANHNALQTQNQNQSGVANGRATPNAPQVTGVVNRSPMSHQQHPAGRASPMVTNAQIGRSSPMISNQTVAARNITPQAFPQYSQAHIQPQQGMSTPIQQQQLPQQGMVPHQVGTNMNYPVAANQFAAMRSLPAHMHPALASYANARSQPSPTPGTAQHVQYGQQQPQPQPTHQPQQNGQEQAAATPMIPNVQFPQAYPTYGMIPQWPRPVGRGAPLMNGQQPVQPVMYPNMPNMLPQQMPGTGRAAMPGR